MNCREVLTSSTEASQACIMFQEALDLRDKYWMKYEILEAPPFTFELKSVLNDMPEVITGFPLFSIPFRSLLK